MNRKIAVIGAGGKMGAGITLLMLLQPEYRLQAIDIREEALCGLKNYLKQQIVRYAEKNINQLRKGYANRHDLISNEEMIDAFTWHALERINFSSQLEDARGSSIIFEAAVENIDAKVAIFKKVKDDQAWIFTNTSSIPISLLNEQAGLDNRIVGFHFYNPPPIQKLVEVIELKNSPLELRQLVQEIGKQLQKTLVYSNDIAGFIGNGYFMREILYTLKLWQSMGHTDLALQQIESATKDFLLRPMGIFQLIDYVGLDVAQNILSIMKQQLPDPTMHAKEIDEWLNCGVKGGQMFDGQQKNGIFKYENGKPIALYSLSKNAYIPLETDLHLGKLPLNLTWKSASKEKDALPPYFAQLSSETTLGAELANGYLKEGKKIAHQLLQSQVAHSIQDVETVLKNGFYHLYEKF